MVRTETSDSHELLRGDNTMKLGGLLFFLAFVSTIVFVTWGITIVGQRMTYGAVEVEKAVKIPVSVSAYNACPKQTDSTPYTMASGKRVYEGAIALSRDIEKEFGLKFGDKITLFGRTFDFMDRMNKRWKRRVDVFMWSKEKAKKFGRQQAVMVIKG